MKTLNRLLLLALAIALVGAAYAIYDGTTQLTLGHTTVYHTREPWLHEVREVSLFGVLIWCLLFVRSQPAFVRVGLVAVILACAIMVAPPHILKEPITLPDWPKSWH